jgi:hypothetical protein
MIDAKIALMGILRGSLLLTVYLTGPSRRA